MVLSLHKIVLSAFFLGATFLPGKVMESFCGFEKSYGDTRTLLGRMKEFPDDLS